MRNSLVTLVLGIATAFSCLGCAPEPSTKTLIRPVDQSRYIHIGLPAATKLARKVLERRGYQIRKKDLGSDYASLEGTRSEFLFTVYKTKVKIEQAENGRNKYSILSMKHTGLFSPDKKRSKKEEQAILKYIEEDYFDIPITRYVGPNGKPKK